MVVFGLIGLAMMLPRPGGARTGAGPVRPGSRRRFPERPDGVHGDAHRRVPRRQAVPAVPADVPRRRRESRPVVRRRRVRPAVRRQHRRHGRAVHCSLVLLGGRTAAALAGREPSPHHASSRPRRCSSPASSRSCTGTSGCSSPARRHPVVPDGAVGIAACPTSPVGSCNRRRGSCRAFSDRCAGSCSRPASPRSPSPARFPGRAACRARPPRSDPSGGDLRVRMGHRNPALWEMEPRLALVQPEQAGFAYEGAAMALTSSTRWRGGSGHSSRELLTALAAAAHLPDLHRHRVRHGATAPAVVAQGHAAADRLAVPPDDELARGRRLRVRPRLLRHQAMGRPQHVPTPYPWQDCPGLLPARRRPGHRPRVVVHPRRAACRGGRRGGAVRPSTGSADLWSGVGLAATFAGGCDRPGLAALREAAGAHEAELGLGMVFAVKARNYAGHVPGHTGPAAAELGGLSVDVAASSPTGPRCTRAGPTTDRPTNCGGKRSNLISGDRFGHRTDTEEQPPDIR